jgi:hypothetical protein
MTFTEDDAANAEDCMRQAEAAEPASPDGALREALNEAHATVGTRSASQPWTDADVDLVLAVLPDSGERAGLDMPAIDRLLAVAHREDDEPCSCDECMSYGAEDAGADWYRIPVANRIAMRILDGADDRLAVLAAAFRDHDADVTEPRTTVNEAGLPERVVVGANGAYWRDFGDGYSMCPVSTDNDPVIPVAVYVRAAIQATPEPASPDGALPYTLTTWRGTCGHLWDRAVEDTEACPRCRDASVIERLRDELRNVNADLADRKAAR